MNKQDRQSARRISEIARNFNITGNVASVTHMVSGHINSSYRITCESGHFRTAQQYLLQRLNRKVFPDPESVMENICRICSHLKQKINQRGFTDTQRRVLTPVPLAENKYLYTDENSEYWRMYLYIADTETSLSVRSPEDAFTAGYAFARFHADLSDLPGPALQEIIPSFHDTPLRLLELEAAVADDICNRAAASEDIINYLLSFREKSGLLVEALNSRTIPRRVVHNDAKMSNILLDVQTGEALCIVDLDTVMPGTVLYDFGDMVRSMTTTAAEDETDADNITLQPELFEALAHGYLRGSASFLTAEERNNLLDAGEIIILEQAVRFLTDYLRGDTYYHTAYPEHNLVRCKSQAALLRSLITQKQKLEHILKNI